MKAHKFLHIKEIKYGDLPPMETRSELFPMRKKKEKKK
jgi:hypothetical protein